MTFARNVEQNARILYDICPKNEQNAPILHDIRLKNNFSSNFGGHVPLPPSQTPMRRIIKIKEFSIEWTSGRHSLPVILKMTSCPSSSPYGSTRTE